MQLEGQQMGHYRLLSLLGSGGMSAVYLAEDLSVRRQVAIKVIRSESAINPEDDTAKEAAHLFRREANAVAMLDHPNILPLYDYGEENLQGEKLTYMVMPFRQEGSLADWLRKTDGSRWLTIQNVAFLIHQAASALQYAHDHHIIHRDVKPSNFLIRGRPENPAQPDLLLADFGIAKFSTAVSSTETMTRGTPIYMPPEQWQDRPVPATDQYALAAMTYELLTGRPPFQGNHSQLMYQHFHVQPNPLSSINPRVSADIDSVVLRALAKQPKDRFPSIASFDQAFQQAVSNINNIRITLTISPLEAINGTSRIITLPDRRMVTVTVPAGAYDGQIIQLADHGIASSYGNPAGALLITIAISRVEETVVSLLNSTTIENTLPEQSINRSQMPDDHRPGFSSGKIMILALVLLLIAGSIGLFFVNMARQNANAQENATATSQANSTLIASTATSSAQVAAQVNASATAQAQESATAITQAEANTTATAQAQANATATAQAYASATAQAQARETAIVIAGLTATAGAQASATAGVLQTATSGQPVYQDALNDATNTDTVAAKWNQDTKCIFAPDGYHEKEDTNWHMCEEATNTYQNVTITVNVRILSGLTGGLLFRVSKDAIGEYSGYLFEINSIGQYRIAFFSQHLTVLSFTYLKNWTTSPALKQGLAASNTLQVIARGVTLLFYVNGVFLVPPETDSTYSSGDIAFYATSDGQTTADVVYSNLNVYPIA
jgi:serine/threonine protein kinase